MPQMNKGGKFIFGKSLIRMDLTIHLPTQAIREYNTTTEGKIYLFTGSKVTGGFCVTRKGLLEPSKLGHILTDNPDLQQYQTAEGEFIQYKGRSYCWISISENGTIKFTEEIMDSSSIPFPYISKPPPYNSSFLPLVILLFESRRIYNILWQPYYFQKHLRIFFSP